MKKLFSIIFAVLFGLFSVVTAQAAITRPAPATAGDPAMILIWVNPSVVSDITKSETILYNGIQDKLKQYQLSYKDMTESQQLMQEYMIENDLVPDDDKTSVGYLPKKEHLRAMAEQAGVKFVIFENARITDEKVKTAWMSWMGAKFEVTTVFTTIIYSVDQDKYVYFKQMSVKENAAGSSSTERAFTKSCESFINKHLDFGNLNFVAPAPAAKTAVAAAKK